jgi:hypothetical protein
MPAYTGRAVELFDNGIEASAVGFNLDREGAPMADNRLRERAQVCDGVVRARVVTVTSKQEETGLSWQIGLHTVEKLAGSRAPDGDFTLTVRETDPAAGILRAFDARFIGVHLVAFVRAFAPAEADSEPDVHFHIGPDQKDEVDAVRAAVVSSAEH